MISVFIIKNKLQQLIFLSFNILSRIKNKYTILVYELYLVVSCIIIINYFIVVEFEHFSIFFANFIQSFQFLLVSFFVGQISKSEQVRFSFFAWSGLLIWIRLVLLGNNFFNNWFFYFGITFIFLFGIYICSIF